MSSPLERGSGVCIHAFGDTGNHWEMYTPLNPLSIGDRFRYIRNVVLLTALYHPGQDVVGEIPSPSESPAGDSDDMEYISLRIRVSFARL